MKGRNKSGSHSGHCRSEGLTILVKGITIFSTPASLLPYLFAVAKVRGENLVRILSLFDIW